jgi:hypothetical protein
MTNDVSQSHEAEWLRKFAKDRFKHGAGVREQLNAIADLIDMTIYVRDMQADLLTRIVNIVKGEPGPGVLMHGIVDLPEIIEDLMKQSGRRAQPTPEVH